MRELVELVVVREDGAQLHWYGLAIPGQAPGDQRELLKAPARIHALGASGHPDRFPTLVKASVAANAQHRPVKHEFTVIADHGGNASFGVLAFAIKSLGVFTAGVPHVLPAAPAIPGQRQCIAITKPNLCPCRLRKVKQLSNLPPHYSDLPVKIPSSRHSIAVNTMSSARNCTWRAPPGRSK